MMRYEILHGNVRERYENVIHTIPEEWEIPQDVERAVSSSLERLKGIPNRCLVPIDTDDGVKLLYSVCCDKMNALSPSYYIHKQLIDCSVEDLLNGFREILQTPVYSEEEFDRIAAGERGVQPTDKWGQGMSLGKRRFSLEAMRAVLCGILDRWQSGSQPVYIGVPAGVDYDAYCFEAIDRIYGLLPAGIRGRVGFMTYGRSVPTDVAVCFVPEGSANDPVLLDRKPERSRTQLGSGLSQEMEGMVDHVIELARTKQDYKAYLKDLYVQIEQGLRLDEIQSETYETMLWIQNLGKGLENRQNFDRLRDRFKEYDTQSAKVQDALCKILNEKVTPEIVTKHLLPPEHPDKLNQYVMEVESYTPMLRHHEGRIATVRNLLINRFNEFVDQYQNDLKALEVLKKFLDSAEPGTNYILNKNVLAGMREVLEGKRGSLREATINQYAGDAVLELKRATSRFEFTAPEELVEQISKIRKTLSGKLATIPDDSVEEIPGASVEKILKKYYDPEADECLSAWHQNKAHQIKGKIPQELTEQAYQAARNELLDWEESCAQESWKEEYQRVREELEEEYTAQGGKVKKALKEKVFSKSNYFCALAALDELKGQLTKDDQERVAKKIIDTKFPTTMKEYRGQYRKYAGEELTYKSLLNQPELVCKCASLGLERLYKGNIGFSIQERSPAVIYDKITSHHTEASHFIPGEDVKVYLKGRDEQKNEGRTTTGHSYNAQQLINTLRWLLFCGASAQDLLPDDQIAALLLQMRDMDVTLGQTIQIAENTFREKFAVKQIVAACVELLLEKGIRSDAESERGLENRLGMIGYPDLYQKLRAKKEQEEAGIVGTGGFLSGWLGSIDWRDIGTGVVYWMIVLSLFVGAFFAGNKHFEPDQASAESYSDAASPATGGEIVPPETTAPPADGQNIANISWGP